MCHDRAGFGLADDSQAGIFRRVSEMTASRHGSHVDVDVRLVSSFISRSSGGAAAVR
jgi:hypothetical protein